MQSSLLSTGESTVNPGGFMEIAIAIGALAAVFAGIGALILFTPYDK
jgi:hypothetical protein